MEQAPCKIGVIIDKYLDAMDYSIIEFARELEVSSATVSRWRNGKFRVPRTRLIKLLKLTGLSMEEYKAIPEDETSITINPISVDSLYSHVDYHLNGLDNHERIVQGYLGLIGEKYKSSDKEKREVIRGGLESFFGEISQDE